MAAVRFCAVAPLQAGQQEQLAGDEGVAPLLGGLVGEVKNPVQIPRDTDLAAVALHLGQTVEGLLDAGHQGRHPHAGALQDGLGGTVVLVDQRRQHVQGLDVGVVIAHRQALGLLDGGLERGGQLVETHGVLH